ncbi:MAG: alpha/beta hydrolase [Actinomycetota bacterium]|nr:alpha/beta hydrolase [Actinomycetota bacterium]
MFVVVAAGAFIAVVLLTAAAVYAARLVVREPGSHHLVAYKLGAGGHTIFFTDEPATRMPGEYGLWFGQGREGGPHARVGDILSVSADERTVERAVLAVHGGSLKRQGRGLWTGHVFATPDEIQVPFATVSLGADGHLPGWVFTPPSAIEQQSRPWVVHVHGIRTTRLTTLRNVKLVSRLGMVSVVPSFRTDQENVGAAGGSSTLGLAEWEDIDLALAYAEAHGAKSVILFGLSLGGMISLLLTRRSAHRHLIAGAILVAPVTNFRATLEYAAAQRRLPRWIGRLAANVLGSSLLYRFTGTPFPLDFAQLEVNTSDTEMNVPSLIIHSPIDDEVPFEESVQFARHHPETVTLNSELRAFHTVEWNLDPDRFEAVVVRWLTDTGILGGELPERA